MKKLLFAIFVVTTIISFTSCRNKKEQDKAKQQVEKVKENVNDAVDKVSDKIEDGADAVKDAWKDTKKDVQNSAEKTKKEMILRRKRQRNRIQQKSRRYLQEQRLF